MSVTRRALSFAFVLVALVAPLAVYSQTALQFAAVTPCRVVDTRWQNGPLGGPTIPGHGSRDFVLPP